MGSSLKLKSSRLREGLPFYGPIYRCRQRGRFHHRLFMVSSLHGWRTVIKCPELRSVKGSTWHKKFSIIFMNVHSFVQEHQNFYRGIAARLYLSSKTPWHPSATDFSLIISHTATSPFCPAHPIK